MSLSRRSFLQAGGSLALASTLGCRGFERTFIGLAPPAPEGPFEVPAGAAVDLVRHALERLGYGPRPEDYARVRALAPDPEDAFELYLEEQLHPESIDDPWSDAAVRRLETLDEPAGELFEYKPEVLLRELTAGTILRAVYSRRQLYESMVGFWTDHFNIAASKGDCRWLKPADDRDVLRRHALGRFPDLLRASALSPAMLWYLDGRANLLHQPDDRPNENYARELLELHTLGVDGGYTQDDVMEVARCLTGWTVRSEEAFKKGAVEFRPELHDDGAKVVLGTPIPASLGPGDLDRVIEIVALHPSTARYLATKLCRRYISDEPSTSAVDAVAAAFERERGDLRATLGALFRTPEFRAAVGTKLKRPFRFLVSALRVTGAEVRRTHRLADYLLRMGHAPHQYPTPDGYPEEPGPWLGTLLWRWNFSAAASTGRLPGVKLATDRLERELGGGEALMAHVLGRQPTAAEHRGFERSGDGLALLLSSPAFQRY